MRVLVGDCDATTLRVISRAFGQEYRITTATTLVVCSELLRRHEFDLVIVCEKLKDGAGFVLLSKLADEQPEALRIFAVRPSLLEALRDRIESLGLFCAIAYPLEIRQLAGALQQAREDLEIAESACPVPGLVRKPESEPAAPAGTRAPSGSPASRSEPPAGKAAPSVAARPPSKRALPRREDRPAPAPPPAPQPGATRRGGSTGEGGQRGLRGDGSRSPEGPGGAQPASATEHAGPVPAATPSGARRRRHARPPSPARLRPTKPGDPAQPRRIARAPGPQPGKERAARSAGSPSSRAQQPESAAETRPVTARTGLGRQLTSAGPAVREARETRPPAKGPPARTPTESAPSLAQLAQASTSTPAALPAPPAAQVSSRLVSLVGGGLIVVILVSMLTFRALHDEDSGSQPPALETTPVSPPPDRLARSQPVAAPNLSWTQSAPPPPTEANGALRVVPLPPVEQPEPLPPQPHELRVVRVIPGVQAPSRPLRQPQLLSAPPPPPAPPPDGEDDESQDDQGTTQ